MPVGENIPLYFRLYHKLKQDIVGGEIEKGAKFDSIEELARQYGVSQSSIRKSFDLLEMEGLLIKKQGRGTIVPPSADLHPIDVGDLIRFKEVTATVMAADIKTLSAAWVKPGARLISLYKLNEGDQEPLVYKLFTRMAFPNNERLIALATHYFNERMMKEIKAERDDDPRDVLIKMSQWGEVNPIEMTHSLRPYLCMGESSEQLGLPDGTPVFFQEFTARSGNDLCHFFEVISTANSYVRKQMLG